MGKRGKLRSPSAICKVPPPNRVSTLFCLLHRKEPSVNKGKAACYAILIFCAMVIIRCHWLCMYYRMNERRNYKNESAMFPFLQDLRARGRDRTDKQKGAEDTKHGVRAVGTELCGIPFPGAGQGAVFFSIGAFFHS